VALRQQGTTLNQRVFVSTLENLPELLLKESIKAPTLIIVGEVVQLHEKLNWFLPSPASTG
jgi:uroporphyrin-III C-methyltransferase / precorrin-2 dehydrogenase / sirohydrochlorin ferrochelatase